MEEFASPERHPVSFMGVWEYHTEDECVRQQVLPKRLQKEDFQLLRNLASLGHFGINKTVKQVQQRFYWPQSSQDIKKWCATCDLCASWKGPINKPLQQYNIGALMERIAMDVLGPLPESTTGNKYIVIIANYFIKWPEAFAIPNQEATTIAN